MGVVVNIKKENANICPLGKKREYFNMHEMCIDIRTYMSLYTYYTQLRGRRLVRP